MIGFDSTKFPDGEAGEADMGRDARRGEEDAHKIREQPRRRHTSGRFPSTGIQLERIAKLQVNTGLRYTAIAYQYTLYNSSQHLLAACRPF